MQSHYINTTAMVTWTTVLASYTPPTCWQNYRQPRLTHVATEEPMQHKLSKKSMLAKREQHQDTQCITACCTWDSIDKEFTVANLAIKLPRSKSEYSWDPLDNRSNPWRPVLQLEPGARQPRYILRGTVEPWPKGPDLPWLHRETPNGFLMVWLIGVHQTAILIFYNFNILYFMSIPDSKSY